MSKERATVYDDLLLFLDTLYIQQLKKIGKGNLLR